LFANPSIAWRRTVYCDEPAIIAFLASMNHPDIKQKGVHFDSEITSTALSELDYSLERDFVMQAFRLNAFVVELHVGCREKCASFSQLISHFGSLFGTRSISILQDLQLDETCAELHLKNPVPLDTLLWRFDLQQDGAAGWKVTDPQGQTHQGIPKYFGSRCDLMEWLFRHY
jgi:hypothetical protein